MINVASMDVKEQAALVCMFYAMLPSKDYRYKDFSPALTIMSQRSGIKVSTLRNHKDAFDALFENGRKGWHQDPLEKRNAFLAAFYQKYMSYSLDEIEKAVNTILEREDVTAAPENTNGSGDSMDFNSAILTIKNILSVTMLFNEFHDACRPTVAKAVPKSHVTMRPVIAVYILFSFVYFINST